VKREFQALFCEKPEVQFPSAYSPNLRKTAPQRRFMPKLPIRHPQVDYVCVVDLDIEANKSDICAVRVVTISENAGRT
jgi:hypothetical protein